MSSQNAPFASASTLVADVAEGLCAPTRHVSSDLHYDEEGSRLFKAIVAQPEYYVGRAERALLDAHGDSIVDALPGEPSPITLVELGADEESKAAYLIDGALGRVRCYTPVNIDRSVLRSMGQRCAARWPGMAVRPLCADFRLPLDLPRGPDKILLVFFPGGTISQLDPDAVTRLFCNVRRAGRRWAHCAVVVTSDRCTDPSKLLPAYDDAAGANAAFNLHLLTRLNRMGAGDFDPAWFAHRVAFNRTLGRVEMTLESLRAQTCHFADKTLVLDKGEGILTGVSYKRSAEVFEALASKGGFRVVQSWPDADGHVELKMLVPRDGD